MSSLLQAKFYHRSPLLSIVIDIDLYVGSPASLALHAHAHFHPSTTLLPSRDFPIQALLFPNSTSISFFIHTVIEQLIQYFLIE